MYTREAHPGENVPAHRAFEDKLAAARLLRDETGIRRPILVDDVDGTVHRAYGVLPNSTFVIARGGTIAYKSMWTSADRVGEFLSRSADGARSKSVAPFYTEQIEYRHYDRATFEQRLERNGPASVAEWGRAVAHWTARTREIRKAARERAGG